MRPLAVGVAGLSLSLANTKLVPAPVDPVPPVAPVNDLENVCILVIAVAAPSASLTLIGKLIEAILVPVPEVKALATSYRLVSFDVETVTVEALPTVISVSSGVPILNVLSSEA